MPRPRRPHLQKEVTRHGRIVWYFRRGKEKRIRIDGDYGSPEFNAAYDAALAGNPIERERRIAEVRATKKPQRTFVYFAQCGKLVKIGISAKPRARIKELEIGSGSPIRLLKSFPGDAALERELHRRFAGDHVRGEWFWLSGSITAFLNGDEAAASPDDGERIIPL